MSEKVTWLSRFNLITKDIEIDLNAIWQKTQDEDKFIKLFSSLLSHEILHREFDKILGQDKNREAGEERIIRNILKQEYPTNIRRHYEHRKDIRRRKASCRDL